MLFRSARIIQDQWTPQASALYDLLMAIFSQDGKLVDLDALKSKSGVSDGDWEDLLQYSAQVCPSCVQSRCRCNDPSFFRGQVLANLVNYRSFGFTKIIPRNSQESFSAVVNNSLQPDKAKEIWEKVWNLPGGQRPSANPVFLTSLKITYTPLNPKTASA